MGAPMDKVITAAEANRQFSRLLREVRDGDSYVVTSHGRPIAKIVPISSDERVVDAARAALLDHLRSQIPVDAGPWSRDELYDDL